MKIQLRSTKFNPLFTLPGTIQWAGLKSLVVA